MNYIFIALEGIQQGLGTGHVVRVKRIIESLVAFDYPEKPKITFITNNPNNGVGYNHIFINDFDQASSVVKNIINSEIVDVVFFDCLDYCQDLYIDCRDKSIITIGIDTSPLEASTLDLLVNPVIKNEFSNHYGNLYSIHYETNTKESIFKAGSRKSIFICFGGIDYQSHLENLLPYVSSIPDNYDVNIVASNSDSVDIASNRKENITIYYQPDNFFELLKQSHMAIISGGILLQEAMYLGIPAYVVPQYDHQLNIAVQQKEKGMILGVSQLNPDYEELVNIFSNSINDKVFAEAVSLKARSSDDGFGLRRIASIARVYDYLPWDSDFFKKEIFMLNTKCYNNRVKNKLDSLIKNKKTDLIYFLCPANNKSSINLAQNDGFVKVDDRLTYSMTPPDFNAKNFIGDAIVQRSLSEDIPDLMLLADNSNWITRYRNDPKFSNEDMNGFYSGWVARSVVGEVDDLVFHIEYDGKIYGFITLKKSGINFGSIGLITVAKEMEGKGFGSTLTSHAVKYMFSNLDCARIEVITQENNTSACVMYEKIGFKPFNHSIYLHKWT